MHNFTLELRNIFEPFDGIRASVMAIAPLCLGFWIGLRNSTQSADHFPDRKKILMEFSANVNVLFF